jgi:hypothetical protein
VKRYGPPRVRKLINNGKRTWIYKLTCKCGWSEVVGGTYGIARRVARAHWDAHWGEWAA